MKKLLMDGHVWSVVLEEMDTLRDMAAVSGYTMERLAAKIEDMIAYSIIEEDERMEEEYKGKGPKYETGAGQPVHNESEEEEETDGV